VLSLRLVVGFIGVVSFTILANLMLKIGAAAPPADRLFFGVLGWRSVAGLALFGCAGMLYAILLRSISLNLAQVFSAAQFVGVVLAAGLVLGEPISATRWLGIAFVAFGILLVGLTARA